MKSFTVEQGALAIYTKWIGRAEAWRDAALHMKKLGNDSCATFFREMMRDAAKFAVQFHP